MEKIWQLWPMVYGLIPILLCTLLSHLFLLKLELQFWKASLRSLIQLLALGLALQTLFGLTSPLYLLGAFMVMVTIASYTINKRIQKKVEGNYWISFVSLLLPSSAIALFTLKVTLPQTPWHSLPHAIPLVGMIIGNGLTGISLANNAFANAIASNHQEIEYRICLGATPFEATREFFNQAIHNGLMPILNTMAVVGLVSIPGMMAGQLLAGNPPLVAVKYQWIILVTILSNCFLAILSGLYLTLRSLFRDQQRFREEALNQLLSQ